LTLSSTASVLSIASNILRMMTAIYMHLGRKSNWWTCTKQKEQVSWEQYHCTPHCPLSYYNWHATDTKSHSNLPAPCYKIRSSGDPARIDQPCVYPRDYISATRSHARINTPVLCSRQSPTKNQDTWGNCLTNK
jgi:hypothetical protein